MNGSTSTKRKSVTEKVIRENFNQGAADNQVLFHLFIGSPGNLT
jgi:hypothetical protein